jgi:hypothetical protein
VLIGIGTVLAAVGLYLVATLDNDPATNVSLGETIAKVKVGVVEIKEGVASGSVAATSVVEPELVK